MTIYRNIFFSSLYLLLGIFHIQCTDGKNLLSFTPIDNPIPTQAINPAPMEITDKMFQAASRDVWLKEVLTRLRNKQEIDINQTVKIGNWRTTALHQAVQLGLVDIVQLLLERGADPNLRDGDGDSPLHLAILNHHAQIIRQLLNQGADPNAINDDGNTPLLLASESGDRHIVRLLLDKGADPNLRDKSDNSVLHLAIGKGYEPVVAMLLNQEADPNAINDDGNTPLLLASESGYQHIVGLLLNKGADPNLGTDGCLPLHLATKEGYKDIVGMLLDKGANPNLEDEDKNFPLHWHKDNRHNFHYIWQLAMVMRIWCVDCLTEGPIRM